MNTRNFLLVAGFFIFLAGMVGADANAGGTEPATAQLISKTITHLEAAIKSLDGNDVVAAQEHVRTAGQSSKLILGGTMEARKQGGSRAITNARQQLEKGNNAGAADALKEAIEAFKSLLRPDKTGNQGGL